MPRASRAASIGDDAVAPSATRRDAGLHRRVAAPASRQDLPGAPAHRLSAPRRRPVDRVRPQSERRRAAATICPAWTAAADLGDTADQMALFDRVIVDDGIAKVVDLGHASFERFFAVMRGDRLHRRSARCARSSRSSCLPPTPHPVAVQGLRRSAATASRRSCWCRCSTRRSCKGASCATSSRSRAPPRCRCRFPLLAAGAEGAGRAVRASRSPTSTTSCRRRSRSVSPSSCASWTRAHVPRVPRARVAAAARRSCGRRCRE